MIPKKYLDRHKRMKWAYVFDKDGKVREPFGTYTLNGVIDELFPNNVIPGFNIEEFSGKTFSKEFDEWCTANLKHGWTLWMEDFNMRRPIFYFETAADALFFKLKWS